ncbi:protein-disulfide reductase DsbD [Salinisphaera sp. USBA-960]|uniref:protein-disulfide reductase DsbD n=1 Tax=Salinisphaera orenii TaxID=856731 RepID=UPI000DBE85FB|nr:protein-disulfide reductase DsbD [Salifodinibacter halophilus]NNC26035.1 protein-disulfide reductase DsbD [Salifodinibacter halophilus]
MTRIAYWLLLLLAACLVYSSTTLAAEDQFLPPDKAFSYQKQVTDNGRIELRWQVADGYYLYRSRMQIEGKDASIKKVKKPDGKLIHDQYFGDQNVYNHDVTVTIDPGQARQIDLTWQGCAKAGLCYPPQHATLDVPTDAGGGSTTASADKASEQASAASQSQAPQTAAEANHQSGDDQALVNRLAQGSIAWTLAVFFGLGLLLAFTPCVLPMVPILSGVIVGADARGLRGAVLSLAFVLPMAVTYAVLGVAAALAGANLQAILQTPAVLGAFALVFVVLALAMFGVFEFQLPAALRDRLNRANENRRGGHIAGAAGMGVISAVLVGPCMTAPLAGALLYIAQSGDVVLGGLALLALGLGMGVPLLVVGTLGAQFMPRPGPWMNGVKAAFGFVLLATALWMISRVLPASVTLGLWGVLFIAAGLAIGCAVRRLGYSAGVGTVAAATGALVLGLWGGLMVVGAAGGAHDPMRPLTFLSTGSGANATPASTDFNDRFQRVHDLASLKQSVGAAKQQDQWTLVDFYADWCVSCKVIERQVYGNAKVQKALANVNLVRPDITDNNQAIRKMMDAFDVVGPPTILFIGPDGQRYRSARIVGELDADAFLEHWRRAQRAAS